MQSNSDTEEIQVDLNQVFVTQLTGTHISMILEIVRASTFQGAKAFDVVDMLNALQAPMIAEAKRIQAARQPKIVPPSSVVVADAVVAAEPLAAAAAN